MTRAEVLWLAVVAVAVLLWAMPGPSTSDTAEVWLKASRRSGGRVE